MNCDYNLFGFFLIEAHPKPKRLLSKIESNLA